MHVRSRTVTRCAVVGAAAAAVIALGAGPAAAHITVQPSSAPKGSEAEVLSFSVPTEREDASTVEVAIQMPDEAKLGEVLVQPKPGWTVAVGKSGDKVSTVTWSGGEIKPGEFDLFSIRAGPLPKKGTHLHFKALQTYSDGEVVRWIEEAKEGAPEPEHPAPELELTKATKGDHGHDD